MLSYFKREWPYLLGLGGGMLFFSLQTLIILVLKLLFYDSKPFEFIPILGIGFFIGAILASFYANWFLFKLSPLVIFLCFALCGIGLSYMSSYIALIVYSCILMIPFGFLLTSGFYLLNAKKFYKYELYGSFLGLIIIGFFIEVLSLEMILISFFILTASLSFLLLKERLVLLSISIFITLTATSFFLWKLDGKEFNLMTYVHEISLPSNQYDNLKNGFDVIKKNEGKLITSRWGLGERIDVVEINKTKETFLYYNNALWSEVLPAEHKETGLFPYFPNTKKFLDIGTGGGQILRQALNWGVEDIKGLEVNEALYSLMTKELKKYSGDIYKHVELIEGRKFLENSREKYDLISVIKKSDIPIFFPTNLNVDYLSTKEGIRAIQRQLADNGYILWDFNIRLKSKKGIAQNYFSILDVVRKNNETNAELLERTLVFSRKKERNYDPSKSDILIIIKKNKILEEEYTNFENLMTDKGYHLIFGKIALKQINTAIDKDIIRFRDSFDEAYKSWGKHNYELFSDKAPYKDHKEALLYKILDTIKWYLLVGIFVFFAIYSKVNLEREIKTKISFISFSTGLYYGCFQIFLVQRIETIFSIPMYSFISVLAMMLLGSAACTFLNKRFLHNKFLLVVHPFAVWGLFAIIPDYGDLGISLKIFIFALIFFIAFTASMPFVELISHLRDHEQHSKNISYLTNSFGFSVGMFVPLILNVCFGVNETTNLIAVSSLIIPTMNYFVQRGYSLRTLEKISSTAFR